MKPFVSYKETMQLGRMLKLCRHGISMRALRNSVDIPSVVVLCMVGCFIMVLPLLRLSFAGEGTKYLAVLETFRHACGPLPGRPHQCLIIFLVFGTASAIANILTAVTSYDDPLAGHPYTPIYRWSYIVFYTITVACSFFMAWIYRHQAPVKGWGMYVAVPIYLFCYIALYVARFTRVDLMDWSWVILLPILVVYFTDRSPNIRTDRGHILLIALLSYATTVGAGHVMLQWLLWDGSNVILLTFQWNVICLVLYIVWRRVALAASSEARFTPLMFALQLTYKLYGELIFMAINLTQWSFWALLLYEALCGVTWESGLGARMVFKLSNQLAGWWTRTRPTLRSRFARVPSTSWMVLRHRYDSSTSTLNNDHHVWGGEGEGREDNKTGGGEPLPTTDVCLEAVGGESREPPLPTSDSSVPLTASSDRRVTRTLETKARPPSDPATRKGSRSFDGQQRTPGKLLSTASFMRNFTPMVSVALGSQASALEFLVRDKMISRKVRESLHEQMETISLGVTIVMALLVPYEWVLDHLDVGHASVTLGYGRNEQRQIAVGYLIIFCMLLASRRYGDWLKHYLRKHEVIHFCGVSLERSPDEDVDNEVDVFDDEEGAADGRTSNAHVLVTTTTTTTADEAKDARTGAASASQTRAHEPRGASSHSPSRIQQQQQHTHHTPSPFGHGGRGGRVEGDSDRSSCDQCIEVSHIQVMGSGMREGVERDVEGADWAESLWYFVACAVYIIPDAMFRLSNIRLSLQVGHVVHAF